MEPAGSIHDTTEDRKNFRSILGSFENERIENGDYEMVIHGFSPLILQLSCKESIRAQSISDRYMFTVSMRQNYSEKSQ